MDIEQRALELVNEVCDERSEHFAGFIRRTNSVHEALCRAIEAHDAFRQEVSDAVELRFSRNRGDYGCLSRFIIQPKTDPLVEAVKALQDGRSGSDPESYAACLRNELKSRGLEIREINNDRP